MKTLLLSPLALGFCENDPYGFSDPRIGEVFRANRPEMRFVREVDQLITISAQVVARKLGKLPPESCNRSATESRDIFLNIAATARPCSGRPGLVYLLVRAARVRRERKRSADRRPIESGRICEI
jgi:hypothetical protein